MLSGYILGVRTAQRPELSPRSRTLKSILCSHYSTDDPSHFRYCLSLLEHTFEQAHELYGDLWLGFKESTLHGFLKKSGFQKIEVSVVFHEENEPHFETLLASGLKAAR